MSIEKKTFNINSLKINGAELDSLLAALSARQDSITAALSSSSGDYNTEILDARADAFGNSHANFGDNIRENQTYLHNLILEKFSVLQSQYDALASSFISLTNELSKLKGEN